MRNHGMMAGGRPTRFAPKGAVSREEAPPEGEREGAQEIREMGRAAAVLRENQAFEKVMEELFSEANLIFIQSPLGAEGDGLRSGARYMIEALAKIQSRITVMAENAKIQEREDAAREAASPEA